MSSHDRAGRIRIRHAALISLTAAALALSACSTVGRLNPFSGQQGPQTRASAGTRVPVLSLSQTLQVSDALRGVEFSVPPPSPLAEWPLPLFRQPN